MTQQPDSPVRILAVYGHPDDEGQVGGTMAAAIAAGHRVTLVCATRGEVGEISHPSLGTPETLGYVRELELRAAMAQLGLADVRFLDYRDSGMAGTTENEDPRSLHQAGAGEVTGRLVALIRELRPHIVFTWDPTGGYGHPDHLAVHRHVLAAFDAAGDGEAFAAAGAPWTAERLYWGASFNMKRFALMYEELKKRGLEPPEVSEERKQRLEAALYEPDPPVSLVLDVTAHLDQKWKAASMHRSQFGENSIFARVPPELRGEFFGTEKFYRARPAWPEGAEPETALW